MPTPPELVDRRTHVGMSAREFVNAMRALAGAGITAAEAGRNLNKVMRELDRVIVEGDGELPTGGAGVLKEPKKEKRTIRYIRVDIIT